MGVYLQEMKILTLKQRVAVLMIAMKELMRLDSIKYS